MGIRRVTKWMSRRIPALVLVFGLFLAYAAVVEAAPQYALDCTSCHSMPPKDSTRKDKATQTRLVKDPTNGAVPGSHTVHAGTSSNSCAKCHGDVSGYGTSHRNKVIELTDSLGYGRKQPNVFMNQTSLPPSPLASCSTALCHSDGKGTFKETPAWGTLNAVDCTTCHGNPPIATSVNSHDKHVNIYGFACAKCHSDHAAELKPFQHATSAGQRSTDVHFSGKNAPGSFSSTSKQCSNLYCHSNGQGTSGLSPFWGTGQATCTTCHGDKNSNTLSGKHASHVNNDAVLGSSYGCAVCHAATVSNNTTILDRAMHVNETVNVVGAQVGTVTNGTCSATTCHTDGKGNVKSVTWTQTQALDCAGCHGTTATFGAPAYTNGGVGANANSHAKHATSSATCANCHSKTTTTGTSIIVGSQHTNGFRNYTSGNGKTFGKQAGLTCSNISCHSGGGIVANVPPAQWGATLDCFGCHNIPASNTGSHTKHLAKQGISCEDCHFDTASGSSAIKDGAPHVNSVINVGGGIVQFPAAGAGSTLKNCTTACHNGTSPEWGNPGNGTVCGTCHSIGPNFGNNFANYYADDQALHNVHIGGTYGPNIPVGSTAGGCASCHAFTTTSALNHADTQFINLDGSKVTNITVGSLNLPKSNTGLTAQCSTCHNQATSWKSSASVGGSRLACESCHNTATPSIINGKTAPDKPFASTSGHGKSGIGQGCQACHDGNSQHIGVVGGTKRLFSQYSSSANGAGCNNCHNSAAVSNAKKKNLSVHRIAGDLGSTCADCHNPHGAATNSMMVNQSINNIAVSFKGNSEFINSTGTGVCQACHTNTAYFKKNIDPATLPAEQQHATIGTDCTQCHIHNPTNGSRAFSAPGNCDSCHGYPPAPRKTLSAISFGTQGQWSSARFEDYSGGGGAHLVAAHIPKSAKASEAWANCTPCHKGGAANHTKQIPVRSHVENVTVSVDPQFRFSNDVDFMGYSSAKLLSGGANKTGGCFNVSCHFTTSLKWSTER